MRKLSIAKQFPHLLAVFTTTIVFFAGLMGYKDYKQKKMYEGYARPLCEKVMKEFDENENGILELQEGVKMAKAVGYDKILPTNNLMFEIKPYYNYNNYFCKEEWMVELRIESTIGYSHRHYVPPFGSGSRLVPLFEKSFYFPLSKLEQLAKSQVEKPNSS